MRKRSQVTLRGRVAVLSPHLDDGVYSLGAAISEGARSGAEISLITVFAGEPESDRAASPWDRHLGFRSAREAARARREEDRRACALLGAAPVWLPFDDEHGRATADDELWSSIQQAVDQADTVLVPGFPLDHNDHLRLARIALAGGFGTKRVALYAEQPYAAVRKQRPSLPGAIASQFGGEPHWQALSAGVPARWRKLRAWQAYRSQFPHFGYRSLMNVLRYEAWHGGELTTLR